ncbi:sce7726 family protein [Chryseobacterium taklimakanense]|uniref:sce7726 family protein n=1 Tax=Chryseobacterium taklimakanense TaxID=536441 RepID=UPI001EF60381|nr:sce7726 family protein [Chryseobacterium taklimakanense]MCG7282013.1 sce7726 family protein [Chryseobacterium taklimakanense]
MTHSKNQFRDFSSLFTRSEVTRWLKNDFQSIDIKLDRYDVLEKNKGNSYLKILKNTYKRLEKSYPNEYIVKNEFLNRFLKKELGNEDSIIYNEFRIGKAIADLAMFNGISKVFEIKTVLDKEYRLSNQIQEYKKIFNEVYIIVPTIQLSKYINYDKNIGIIAYDNENRKFELIQKSVRNYEMDKDVVMEILHTKEYMQIVNEYFKELPEMNSFNQFQICKDLIKRIPNEDLNKLFLKTMKKRNINNLFFNKFNSEFNQICLSLNLNQTERDVLIKNLKSNIV